ncbi:putative ribonuclease H protein [Vitis vinifera]|uniref:Putative ribonuclease H protein n=1 Tax=Vitis vinifera TaxID=29760 RepID=A0A438DGA8_VITVI|nr:putative ribonuclease H protein [Vitis vinifera]
MRSEVVERKTVKVLIERKTFLIRLEGDQGGEWCSMTEISRGSVFALGFEKEAVGWLVEYLKKGIALKSHMGFNKKFRGKCRAHLLEVGFNNHGRFIRISEFATNRKPSVLIIPEGDKGRGWESLKNALATMLVVPNPYAEEKGRNLRGESWPHYKVGSMHRSYANTVSDEGPRGGGLVPVGRWARAVICESKFDRENWAEVGRLVARSLGKNGVVTIVPFSAGKGVFFVETTKEALFLHDLRKLRVGERNIIQLRRWSPKENAELDRKFREGWIELRGLPFHLWSEVHLKKIVDQWGSVKEIDWRTLKLFDLSSARLKIVMRDRAILPAMLEVTDGDWAFTVVVVVVGDEERRRGSEKGESTRVAIASHMETGGGRRGECGRSTEEGRYHGMDGIGEGGVWAGEDEAIADVGCRARERKAQLLAKTDPSGAVMGCKIKGLLGLGLSPDGVTPVVIVASSREEEEDASSANEKVKSAPGLLEFQSSRLAEKKVLHGSRKRWSTFFPPSSEHRQGIRSNSEPISRGKIKVDSEEDPKTDDLGAKSQANRGLNASPLFSPCLSRPRKENLGERDSSPRKEADLKIFSSNEDMEGFLGRVGSDSRGSAAMVKPSSPETRGKGPSLMGNCVPRVAENLECPSTPMSSDSSSQSLAPMENRPACPYQMSESVNSLSANLRSPCKESSKATVHLGGIAGSPSGEFQIEGLSPTKMAKVREVLKKSGYQGIFQEEEQMLHRIVRLSGFGSEIRVTIVSHEDNQLEYQGFGLKEKEKGARNKDWAALPACGASGGILIIWDAKKLSREEVVLGSFSVSIKFALNGCESLWLSAVYGPNISALRKDFWVELPDIAGLASPRCDCELIDLPLRSASFTWSNMQVNPVCKRLDRFLYSNEWEQAFPQSIQGVLPRWTSDHWPIVLETNPFKWGPTPFRFENMWLQHPSFKENFGRWWREFQGNGWEGHKFMRKLQFVKTKLKVWNKASFGELRRIRGVLHETIHSTQGAFVQGRQILDAVLIANEIVDEKRRSGEEGVMEEMDERLLVLGFFCSPGERMLLKAEERNVLEGFKVVNLDKSNIYGINLEQNHLSRLAEMLDCKASGWPILYLGLPLGGNPKTSGLWDPVIERISRRLDGWQKAYLSFGGRITLIQSCLTNMPCYFLSLFKIPASVAAKIERMQRDFLWSGVGEGKRDHLVNWDVVCKPKSRGGLGFGKISIRNVALLGKWLWRYPREGFCSMASGDFKHLWITLQWLDVNNIVRWSSSLSLEGHCTSLPRVFQVYSVCGR